MKFGLMTINMALDSGQAMLDVACAAEAAGFESLWTAEHLMFPVDLKSKYPYTPDGSLAVPPDMVMVDPLVCLSAIAARTSTIKLGTGVSLLAAHNPLVFAKQAASVDFISNGRLILGLAVGWMREDYDVMGIPFAGRGARMDDYIVAVRKVWTGDVVEHHSQFLDWSGFKSHPTPTRKTGVPITIGGRGEKNFERVAKLGTDWFGPDATVAEVKADLDALKAACDRAGRDFSTLEISVKRADIAEMENRDEIAQFEALGVHRVWCPLFGSTQERIDTIQRLGETLIRG